MNSVLLLSLVLSSRGSSVATVSSRSVWHEQGICYKRNARQKFDFLIDSNGRFRWSEKGATPEITGYDGDDCWLLSQSGVPHTVVLQERDVRRMLAWVFAGSWKDSHELVRTKTGPSSYTLKPSDGVVSATLTLDRSSRLPHELSYWTSSGPESWTFSNYKHVGSRMRPMRAEHKIGPQAEWISINSTSAIPNRTAYFKMPPADPAGVIFDKSVSPDLEVRPMYGFMFVHPKVDGKDVGWFFLDSGADVMCIDPAIAKTLGLKTVGGDVTAGAVGVAITPIGLAHKFQLGPVTLNNPIFYQLDLSAITKALNMPIAGVCGYDFIARTSLDIDLTQRQIRVLPPGQAILPAKAHWDRIDFDSNTPCIRCGFEGDHKGVFNLDTGSNSSVELFGPEVEKDHFLTRKTSGGRTSGAGGSAAVREGKLDWFEIGGTRLDKLDASFELTKKGVFASPYLAGNVGMGVLNKFHLLFDYQNSRMAFIAR